MSILKNNKSYEKMTNTQVKPTFFQKISSGFILPVISLATVRMYKKSRKM